MIKGLTLIETLVTTIIFSFIVIGIYGVLNIAQTNYDMNSASLNLQQQARQGMNRLSREVRQAYWSSISVTGPDANNNYAVTFNTPDASGVRYYITETSVSGQMLWQLIREYPTNNIQIKATGATIPNNIAILNLSMLSGHILNIQMTTSKTFLSGGRSQTLTFPLTEQVEVRNP